jgi:quercetin 2,3-dioxygenase
VLIGQTAIQATIGRKHKRWHPAKPAPIIAIQMDMEERKMELRRSGQRGSANLGWLKSRHTFSFGNYHDAKHMGFGVLRVINEDQVEPGQGFQTHAHSDMEIISYVLEGALEHKDSLGTGSVIRPGDVQRMSAGTGIRHSEFNHSKTEPVHFLQIWILPERDGAEPGYEQKQFSAESRCGRLRLVGSRDAREGSVTIHQDVDLYAALLSDNEKVTHTLRRGRDAWLQVARGEVSLNGETLRQGDGVAISEPGALAIEARADAEILLFDMASD